MRIEVNKVIYFNALQSKRKMDRKQKKLITF